VLLPTRRRPWAPQGHRPIIASHDQQDRISALAILTVSPKRPHLGLDLRFPPRTFQAIEVADFLRALLRHLRGHISLRWDRGSIHRGPAIDAVRQAHPRLHLEECPAYAPELNPTEQRWNAFTGRTANSLWRDKRQLRHRLSTNARRVRRSQANLRACIRSATLPSPP